MKKVVGSTLFYFGIYFFLLSGVVESINWAVYKPVSLDEIRNMNDDFTSWGNHNLIFLVFFVFINYAASLGSGMVARNKKFNFGITLSLVMIFLQGMLYFTASESVRTQTTFSVGAFNLSEFPIASWIAIASHLVTGKFGYEHGNEICCGDVDGLIFNIPWYHWIWMLSPLPFNPIFLIYVNLSFSLVTLFMFMKPDVGFVRHLLECLLMLPVITSGFALFKFYEHLSNQQTDNSKGKRFFIGLGILLGGVVAGLLSQILIFGIKDWAIRNIGI